MKDKLKELVYNEGLHILLDRLAVLHPSYELEKLLNPVIVDAKIVDMDAVISKIKERWHTCFNIKDVEIDLEKQIVKFRYFGGPYFVPKKYSSFIILGQNEWSPVQTEYCDYERTTEEQDAGTDAIKLIEFKDHGIELTLI
jgi:hypothetical protein